MQEQQVVQASPSAQKRTYSGGGTAVPFSEIRQENFARYSTGMKELDSVLGGGIVPASLILCGGDPGIGKSTLLLQLAGNVAKQGTVVYASAEESAQQVKLRADRLGVTSDGLLMLAETELNKILFEVERIKPKLVIVDSVQTVFLEELSGAQGSVSQVRECTARLMRFAKSSGVSVILVGHVTKDGAIAGPKVLEHLVDTVLYFEGEQSGAFRVLRAVKNRFGSSNEIGIFEMTDRGMRVVANPSERLLSEDSNASGNAVMCTMEGSRPLLCEVQALVSRTAFVNPRRSATGFDYNRTAMLLAVLEKRLGYGLFDKDVYINIAGGIRVDDPGADIAVLAAVASAIRDITIPRNTVLFGEVGLTGEIRGISMASRRAAECVRLGFHKIIAPKSCKKDLQTIQNADIIYASTLEEALKACFG